MSLRRPVPFAAALCAVLAACDEGRDLVNLNLCPGEGQQFVAFRLDDGPWSSVGVNEFGEYLVPAAARVSVAQGIETNGAWTTTVIYATGNEMEAIQPIACPAGGESEFTGSVVGLGPADAGQIAMGGARAVTFEDEAPFQLMDAPDGPADIVALQVSAAEPGPLKFILRRDADPVDGTTLPVFDFGSTEAAAPAARSLAIANLTAGDQNRVEVYFQTATTTSFPIQTLTGFSSGTQSLALVPASLTRATDRHTVDVIARNGTSFRGDRQFFSSASDRTAALGAALEAPTFTTIGLEPYPRFRMTLNKQSDYPSFVSVRYSQPAPESRRVVVIGTAGFFGSAATWDLEIPDLSGAPGFAVSSALRSNDAVTWQAEAYQGAFGAFRGALSDGARLRYAGRTGEIPLP